MILLTADDFGISKEVNRAILKAHRAGVLHCASLMMGEEGTQDAVALARKNPSLRVGLHLVLVDGKSVLPPFRIRHLVDAERNFPRNPAATWLSYLFNPLAAHQLEREIRSQFEAFRMTGLRLSHVDGHHHQHIHPRVWPLVVELARIHGAQWVRLPRENLSLWKKTTTHRSWWKPLHGRIYRGLTLGKKAYLQKHAFLSFDGVFGILETFSMTREYVLNVLRENPKGLFEFYFHPGALWNHDIDILTDPDVVREAQKFRLPDPWDIRP